LYSAAQLGWRIREVTAKPDVGNDPAQRELHKRQTGPSSGTGSAIRRRRAFLAAGSTPSAATPSTALLACA
jgi:hypothetical protein